MPRRFAIGLQRRAGLRAAAYAASLDEALAHFTADDFSETITGIKEVAASGSPRAEAIIRALQDGQLMYSAEKKAVYIKSDSGKLLDAATGQPIAGDAPADVDTVRLNNRLRGAIDAALGGLDAARRRSRACASTPHRRCSSRARPVRCRRSKPRIAKEQDPRVKRALMEARAAIILLSDTSQRRRQARGGRSHPSTRRPGRARAPVEPAGRYFGAGREKRRRRASPPSRTSLAVWEAVQNAWYGISLGSVLLLAAIGLAITFGVMGVINMAHGEMVMLGAYVTFVVQEVIRARQPGAVRLFAGHRHSACIPGCRLPSAS